MVQKKGSTPVSYFDIMVSNALHQGVEYHMWLFYFPLLTEKIVRNYSPRDPLFEAGVEWETRYNFLLYLLFSAMIGWIDAVCMLGPKGLPNCTLRSVSTEHQNENIPKSAIIALGSSLWHVVMSEQLSPNFRYYILCQVFDLYLDLKRSEAADYSRVLVLVLSDPTQGLSQEAIPTYRLRVLECIERYKTYQKPLSSKELEEIEAEIRKS